MLVGHSHDLKHLEEKLATCLIGRAAGWKNELWEKIDSTSNRAAALAAAGAGEGVIVLAREQTAGKGRLGRGWISPPDSGIYMSILLRPVNVPVVEIPVITLACGAAVSAAVECSTGVRLRLKWVNDLVLGGRKVGGILAEMPALPAGSSTAAAARALIIEIGINVRCDRSIDSG